ncbi:MAG: transcriptional regulator [Clostridia bacterium]|nr:transcriptional regulator [Clostridia bacterium]
MNLSLFAERLSDLLFEADLNPPAFAKIMGCGRSSVNRYLSGRKMPTVEMLVKMADHFKCSTDFLLGLEDENYNHHFVSPPPFSERLSQILEYFGISRYKLEKITSISESTLFYWAKGQTSPTIEKIIVIAKALDCTVDFIIGRTKS